MLCLLFCMLYRLIVIGLFGGIGNQQLIANVMAIAGGGGVRIGLEDNLFWLDNKTFASNRQLLDRVREIARMMGREIMSPSEFGNLVLQSKNEFAPHYIIRENQDMPYQLFWIYYGA